MDEPSCCVRAALNRYTAAEKTPSSFDPMIATEAATGRCGNQGDVSSQSQLVAREAVRVQGQVPLMLFVAREQTTD